MPVQGFIEAIEQIEDTTYVNGWTNDTDTPTANLMVEICVDGLCIGSTVANRPRLDLVQMGIGEHAYSCPISNDLPPEVLARLVARVVGVNGFTAELPRWQPKKHKAVQFGKMSFDGNSANRQQHPVFILGAPRSGTSVVAQSLLQATQYRGQNEGHIIHLLDRLATDVHHHYTSSEVHFVEPFRNYMVKQIPESFFQDGLSAMFVEAMQKLFPAGYWIDKTPLPAMIRLAPRLLQLWPNAKFIFMRRRGIENLLSRSRKFLSKDFRLDCYWWSLSMEAWSAVRNDLGGAGLELDQRFVATAPEDAGREIGRLLGLSPEQTAEVGDKLARHQPERTSKDPSEAVDPAAIKWTPQTWATFEELCGVWMDHYNYSRDAKYFSNTAPENTHRRV